MKCRRCDDQACYVDFLGEGLCEFHLALEYRAAEEMDQA